MGTVIGAAAGAAIGAAAENAGAGAAIGGATGLVGGTAVGTNNAAASEYDLQTHYNIAYTQCMYARGDTVQYLPPDGNGYYDYGIVGYPWYDWSGPGFFGGGVFVFDRDHEFHRGFHGGFYRGSHEAFHGGSTGGSTGASMAEGEYSAQPPPLQGCAGMAGRRDQDGQAAGTYPESLASEARLELLLMGDALSPDEGGWLYHRSL